MPIRCIQFICAFHCSILETTITSTYTTYIGKPLKSSDDEKPPCHHSILSANISAPCPQHHQDFLSWLDPGSPPAAQQDVVDCMKEPSDRMPRLKLPTIRPNSGSSGELSRIFWRPGIGASARCYRCNAATRSPLCYSLTPNLLFALVDSHWQVHGQDNGLMVHHVDGYRHACNLVLILVSLNLIHGL